MNVYEVDRRSCLFETKVERLFFNLSKEGVLLNGNEDFFRILDCDRESIISTSMWNIVHEDDRSLFIQRIVESSERNLIPFTFRFADLKARHQAFYIHSCKWVSLDEVCIQASLIVDSSEYPAIERLVEQQVLIEDITNNLEVGICQYDIEKEKFLYISPAIQGLLGIPIADLMRDPWLLVKKCHVEDQKELSRFYKELSVELAAIEYRILQKDGEIQWVRANVTPIKDETGKLVRYISIMQDITQQKIKDELLQKWDKLNIVGQLAASLAHQIRNPLTTVKGFVQLLELKDDPTFKAIINEELENIETIIEEFLQLAKPSNTTTFSVIPVQEKIKRIVSLLEEEAAYHKVTFQLNLENEDVFIQCVLKQIQQVFINIIKNAMDAMPDGGVIEIGCAMEEGTKAKITIADTGIGMSSERLRKLGEPFYSQKEKGTGLGLMVSYKIIENHHGTIQFESKEGVGTIVTIHLPIIVPS